MSKNAQTVTVETRNAGMVTLEGAKPVGVGMKGEKVTFETPRPGFGPDDKSLETGRDILSWDNPEGYDLETGYGVYDETRVCVVSEVHTGVVDSIYLVDYSNDRPTLEVSIKKAPLGRLDVTDCDISRVDRYLSQAPEPTAGSLIEKWLTVTPWMDMDVTLESLGYGEYETDENW